ncbi:tetratricopeptide repeat protein [Gemmatimonadota bacterium]
MSDRTIGQYQILRKIGEGGMGVVYEAEQQHPKRNVALKVIRGGQFVDETTIRMFQREAQSLALLKHASIASIYESGHTDDGAHFFAMELVQGKPLNEWLAERPAGALTTTELRLRLGLLRQICEGVSYAHQRGVIHRDLKPGNILVLDDQTDTSESKRYSGPGIKILDFGLARITETDVQAASMVTEVGTILGTLHYMSPEQVQGIPDNIDVRSDVYALGVLLYEILTGQLPYNIREAGFHDALGIILDSSPTPLSKLWVGDKKVDRDLEIIGLKALEKDPGRRYQSALALAEDIDHFLSNQPILARPPSTIYQLQKMVKRHTVPSVLAVVLAVLVVGFGFVSAAQARRIAQERDAANIARDESEAVTGFLTSTLASADPSEGRRDLTVLEVLEVQENKIDTDFTDRPLIQARLHHTVGIVYHSLGKYSQAEEHLQQALEIRQRDLPELDLETLKTRYGLVKVYYDGGRIDEAEQSVIEVLDDCRKALGDNAYWTLTTMNVLAVIYLDTGRIEEAEGIAREAVDRWLARRDAGIITNRDEKDEEEQRLTALNTMFGLYMSRGQFEQATPIAHELYESDLRNSGPESTYTLYSMHNLAYLYHLTKRYAQAESLYTETWELRKKLLGEDHTYTLATMGNLAELYAVQERWEDAESQFLNTLELYNSNPNLRLTHDRAQRYINALAEMYEVWGKPEQAARWREQLVPPQ